MTPIQTRIKKVSRIFRWLFQILFIVIPIVHILAWINAPMPIDVSGKFGFFINVIPKGTEILHPLSVSTRIYSGLVSAIPMLLLELIVYFLIRLFKLYEQGQIFSLQNVKYIKKTGYALLIFQIVRPLSDGFLTALLTWGNGHGHRYATITVSGTDLSMVLTAFIIILVSWIMTEGCRLREEQQLTI
ncbi:MAG TPA: DUF2975 domain-containing protein [Gammaproteobacteria bacterium]|nr:DUF2975 domain-containing protein [Gammaproteobacteria bacterium]